MKNVFKPKTFTILLLALSSISSFSEETLVCRPEEGGLDASLVFPEAQRILEQVSSECKVISEKTKLSAYYPHHSGMEGGTRDRRGKRLNTLHEFLEGRVPYVSVALDLKSEEMKGFEGRLISIPAIDAAYAKEMSPGVKAKCGGRIPFKVVDTGGAFHWKKWAKLDICVGYPGKRGLSDDLSKDKRLNQSVRICEY